MPENRTKTGRFASGASGNPGGRPKAGEQEKAAREAMKGLCMDAVKLLKKTMLDEKANMNIRIRVAEFIVTNVCGKPTQDVKVSTGDFSALDEAFKRMGQI